MAQTAVRHRDAQKSRREILAAACDELAAHGSEFARVDRIAARAGVDKRLLYYYFGNRDAILAAAMTRQKSLMHVEFSSLELDALDARDALRRILELLWDTLDAQPNMSLAVFESPAAGQAQVAHAAHIGLLDALHASVRKGVDEGIFVGSVNVRQLAVSVISLTHYFFKNTGPLSAVVGEDLAQPAARRRRLADVMDLIFRSVLRDPRESALLSCPLCPA